MNPKLLILKCCISGEHISGSSSDSLSCLVTYLVLFEDLYQAGCERDCDPGHGGGRLCVSVEVGAEWRGH